MASARGGRAKTGAAATTKSKLKPKSTAATADDEFRSFFRTLSTADIDARAGHTAAAAGAGGGDSELRAARATYVALHFDQPLVDAAAVVQLTDVWRRACGPGAAAVHATSASASSAVSHTFMTLLSGGTEEDDGAGYGLAPTGVLKTDFVCAVARECERLALQQREQTDMVGSLVPSFAGLYSTYCDLLSVVLVHTLHYALRAPLEHCELLFAAFTSDPVASAPTGAVDAKDSKLPGVHAPPAVAVVAASAADSDEDEFRADPDPLDTLAPPTAHVTGRAAGGGGVMGRTAAAASALPVGFDVDLGLALDGDADRATAHAAALEARWAAVSAALREWLALIVQHRALLLHTVVPSAATAVNTQTAVNGPGSALSLNPPLTLKVSILSVLCECVDLTGAHAHLPATDLLTPTTEAAYGVLRDHAVATVAAPASNAAEPAQLLSLTFRVLALDTAVPRVRNAPYLGAALVAQVIGVVTNTGAGPAGSAYTASVSASTAAGAVWRFVDARVSAFLAPRLAHCARALTTAGASASPASASPAGPHAWEVGAEVQALCDVLAFHIRFSATFGAPAPTGIDFDAAKAVVNSFALASAAQVFGAAVTPAAADPNSATALTSADTKADANALAKSALPASRLCFGLTNALGAASVHSLLLTAALYSKVAALIVLTAPQHTAVSAAVRSDDMARHFPVEHVLWAITAAVHGATGASAPASGSDGKAGAPVADAPKRTVIRKNQLAAAAKPSDAQPAAAASGIGAAPSLSSSSSWPDTALTRIIDAVASLRSISTATAVASASSTTALPPPVVPASSALGDARLVALVTRALVEWITVSAPPPLAAAAATVTPAAGAADVKGAVSPAAAQPPAVMSAAAVKATSTARRNALVLSDSSRMPHALRALEALRPVAARVLGDIRTALAAEQQQLQQLSAPNAMKLAAAAVAAAVDVKTLPPPNVATAKSAADTEVGKGHGAVVPASAGAAGIAGANASSASASVAQQQLQQRVAVLHQWRDVLSGLCDSLKQLFAGSVGTGKRD